MALENTARWRGRIAVYNAIVQRLLLLLTLSVTVGCAPAQRDVTPAPADTTPSTDASAAGRPDTHPRPSADVVSVTTRGVEGGYEFAVGVASPDTGCDRYANWWEVVSEEGELLYRRPLAHSHVDEQPFVRSGGPVAIEAETTVWVRAHLHPIGYGEQAFRGSVAAGFEAVDPPRDFALDLVSAPPAPPSCRF